MASALTVALATLLLVRALPLDARSTTDAPEYVISTEPITASAVAVYTTTTSSTARDEAGSSTIAEPPDVRSGNTTAGDGGSVDVTVGTNVSIALVVEAALRAGGPALEEARDEVAAVAEQIERLVEAAYAQNASLTEELLEHILRESRYAVRLVNAGTHPDLEELDGQLEHLLDDMEEGLAQVEGDSQLEADLRDLQANITRALEAVREAMRIPEDAAWKLVVQVNVTASKQVDALLRGCRELVQAGREVLENLTSKVETFNAEFAVVLSKSAEAAIAVGTYAIQQINTIVENWNYSLNELQLHSKLLIAANLGISPNNITQTTTEIVQNIESLISSLSLELTSQIKYTQYFLFTYKSGLEIQISTAGLLINISEGNTNISLTEMVNEVLQLKQVALQNVSSILYQMLQFANESSSQNNANSNVIILIIRKQAQIMQKCIENGNIQEVVEVITQVQTQLRIIIQGIQNMTDQTAQDLTKIMKTLLVNIENALNEINKIIFYAENKIKDILAIFSNQTQILVQNTVQFAKTIINRSQLLLDRINNMQTLSETLKYQLEKITQNVVQTSKTALTILANISSNIEYSVNETSTKILQMIFETNMDINSQNNTSLEKEIIIVIYKLVNQINGNINSTLNIQFSLSQILQNQLNTINGITTLSTRALQNEVVTLADSAFNNMQGIIISLQGAVEYANTINVTVISELAVNITAYLNILVIASENRDILQVSQNLQIIISILEKGLDLISNISNPNPPNLIVLYQNLLANITNVYGQFVNIQQVVTTSVTSTVSGFSGFLRAEFNVLLASTTNLQGRIIALLERITQEIGRDIATAVRQILQTFLSQIQDIINLLQTSLSDLTLSEESVINQMVEIIFSYYKISTGSYEEGYQLIEQISITLTAWLSQEQGTISTILGVIISFTDSVNNQENFINIITNILSGGGPIDVGALISDITEPNEFAFQTVQTIIISIEQVIEYAATLNITAINQFTATLDAQVNALAIAVTNRNILQGEQIIQYILATLQEALNVISTLPNEQEELQVYLQNIIQNINGVIALFVNINQVVTNTVLSTVSTIAEFLRSQGNTYIGYATQLAIRLGNLYQLTELIGGDIAIILNQTLQKIQSQISDITARLTITVTDTIATQESITNQIFLIIYNYYPNYTGTDETDLKINQQINSIITSWIIQVQAEFKHELNNLFSLTENVNIQERQIAALYNALAGSGSIDIGSLFNEITGTANYAFKITETIIIYIQTIIEYAATLNNTIITQLISTLTQNLNLLITATESQNIVQVTQILQNTVTILEEGLDIISTLPLTTELEEFTVIIQNCVANTTNAIAIFVSIQETVTSTVFSSVSSIFLFLNTQLETLTGSATQLNVTVVTLMERITVEIGGDIAISLRQTLETLQLQIQDLHNRHQTTVSELVASEDSLVSEISVYILSLYKNYTSSDATDSIIVQQISVIITSWLTKLQDEISSRNSVLLTLTQTVNTQVSFINVLIDIFVGNAKIDINAIFTEISADFDNVILFSQSIIVYIQQLVEYAATLNVAVITQFISTLTVELNLLITATDSLDIVQVYQNLQNIITILEGGLEVISTLPQTAELEEFTVIIQNCVANATNVIGIFVRIQQTVSTTVLSTVSSIFVFVHSQLETLIGSATQLNVRVVALLERITDVIGGDIAISLRQTLQTVRSQIQDFLIQLQTTFTVVFPEQSLVNHIVEFIISSYNDYTGSDITDLEIIQQISVIITSWLAQVQDDISSKNLVLLAFSQTVNTQESVINVLVQSLSGSGIFDIDGLINEITILADNAFQMVQMIIISIQHAIKYAVSLNVTVITQYMSILTVHLNLLVTATSGLEILQVSQILQKIVIIFEDALELISTLPQTAELVELTVIFENCMQNISNVNVIFFNIHQTVSSTVVSAVSSISVFLRSQVETLIASASQLNVRVVALLERISEVFTGDIAIILNQTLQIVLSQVEYILSQLKTSFIDLTSSEESFVNQSVVIVLSYYKYFTGSVWAISEIVQQINTLLTSWLTQIQGKISSFMSLLLCLTDAVNIQENLIIILSDTISGNVSIDIGALYSEITVSAEKAIQIVQTIIIYIQQVVEYSNDVNITVISQLSVTLEAQLLSLVNAVDEVDILKVSQFLQAILSTLLEGLDLIATFPDSTSLGDLSVRYQNLISNITGVNTLFVSIQEVVSNAILATVSVFSTFFRAQLNLLVSLGIRVTAQLEMLLVKMTNVIEGDLGFTLGQLLQIILTWVQNSVMQLEGSIDILTSGITVVTKIGAIIFSNIRNQSDEVFLDINKEINLILVSWCSQLEGFISFYVELFFNLDYFVNIFIEISVELEKIFTGNGILNLTAVFMDALSLRNNAIAVIEIVLQQILQAVNTLPSIGVDAIEAFLSTFISQVNSILQSIQAGNIEYFSSKIEELLAGIKSLINELNNVGDLPGVSNVLEIVISQLESLAGNITTALDSLKVSVQLVTVAARDTTIRVGYLLKSSITIFATFSQLFIKQGNMSLRNFAVNSDLLIHDIDEIRDSAQNLIHVGEMVSERVQEISNDLIIGFLEESITSFAASFLFNISLNATDLSSLSLELRSALFSSLSDFFKNVQIEITAVVNIFTGAVESLQKLIGSIFSSATDLPKNITKSIDELLQHLLYLQQAVQLKVKALGAQTLKVVEELESFVGADLLVVIETQIENILYLVTNSSESEALSRELESLISNLGTVAQHLQNATNNLQGDALVEAQRLIGELDKIVTTVTNALNSVKEVILTFAEVVQAAVASVNNIVKHKVKDLLKGAHFLIRKGEEALENFTNNTQIFGGQFFQKLEDAAQASIDAGYKAIKVAQNITDKLSTSSETIEQEINALILESLRNLCGISVNVIQLANEVIIKINNQPNLLLSQVRNQIQDAENIIFTAGILLKNSMQIAYKLLNLFKVVISNIQSGNVSIDFEALLYNLTQVQNNALYEATIVIAEILEVIEFAFENNNYTVSAELLANIKTLATTALQLAQSGNIAVVDQLVQLLGELSTNIKTVLKQARDVSSRLEGEARSVVQILVTKLIKIAQNTTTLLNTVKASMVAHTLFVIQEAFHAAYIKIEEQVTELISRGTYLIQKGKTTLGSANKYALEMGPDAVAKLEEVARFGITSGEAAIKQAKEIISNLTISFEVVIQSILDSISNNVVNITQVVITIDKISTEQLTSLLIRAQSTIDVILNFLFGADLLLQNQIQITDDLVNLVKTLLFSFNSTDLSDFFNMSLSNVNALQQAVKDQVSLLVSQILKIVGVAGENGVVSVDLLAAIKSLAEQVSLLALSATSSAIEQLQEPLEKLLISVQRAIKQAQNNSLAVQGEARVAAQQVITVLLEVVESTTEALLTVKASVIAQALYLVHQTVAESSAVMKKEVQEMIDEAQKVISAGQAILADANKNAHKLGEKAVAKLLDAGKEAIETGQAILEQANNIYLNWTTSVSSYLQASLSAELNLDNIAESISQISVHIANDLKALLCSVQDSVKAGMKILSRVEKSLKTILDNIKDSIGGIFGGIIGGIGGIIGSIFDLGDSLISDFKFKLL